MSKQFSTTVRNAWLATYESTIGTTPKLDLRTGAQESACSATATGTSLILMTLPSDWMTTASAGFSLLNGTWSGTVSANGTPGHYRLLDSAGTTCHEQGSITRAFTLATSASTTAGSNVLTFTSTAGVSAGMTVSASGVPSGTTVLSTTSTTVTLSAVTTGVSSATNVYFGDLTGDLWLNATSLSAGQVLTITGRSLYAPGA